MTKSEIPSIVCRVAVVLLAMLTTSTQASECSDFVNAYQAREKVLDVYFSSDSLMDRVEASTKLTFAKMETDAAAEALRRTIADETAGAIMEQWVSAQESLLDAWNNVSAKMLLVDQLRAISSSARSKVREGRILLADAYYEMVYAIGCQ